MRHVVLAPDKFKGSLTAAEVAAHLAVGLRRADPELRVDQVPMADGGEGTVDAALAAGFRAVPVRVTGPTGQPVDAAIAVRDDTAVVELALASGLAVLPGGRLDPLGATSFGTGELVRAALDTGCRNLVLGVGGSACTDGGSGMLAALGARLLDGSGAVLPPGGGALAGLARVELDGLDARLRDCSVVLAADVDSPLLGPSGAAAVFGPQKGAGPDDVELLEHGLGRWVDALETALGAAARRAATAPGAGAAGGVGYAALAALGGRRRPGVEVVLELTDLAAHLPGADLVVTGEGSLDGQSLRGKTPLGVAAAAARAGVRCVAVAGRVLVGPDELAAAGLAAAHALLDLEPAPAVSMREAGRLLEQLAETRLSGELRPPRQDPPPGGSAPSAPRVGAFRGVSPGFPRGESDVPADPPLHEGGS